MSVAFLLAEKNGLSYFDLLAAVGDFKRMRDEIDSSPSDVIETNFIIQFVLEETEVCFG